MISTLYVRIRSNQGVVEFINNTSQEVKFSKRDMRGILDMRSLGYFKVNYEDLVRKLSQQFTFFHHCKNETIHVEKESFFKLETKLDYSIHTHHKAKSSNSKDPYPLLEPDDPCRHQTDAKILSPRICPKWSALITKKKSHLMALLLKYRKAFSLRDEIG